MSKRNIYRIASTLIVLSVLFSQLGLKFLHTHLWKASETTIAFEVQSDNASTPCPACSMDCNPVLYTVPYCLPCVSNSCSSFVESFPDHVRRPISGLSLGRAPPIA